MPPATNQPEGKASERNCAADQNRQHVLAALLPDQDAEHDAAHTEDGQERTHDIHLSAACIRHVMHQLDHHLEQKGDSPGEEGGDKPPKQGSDCGRYGSRCTDECIDPLLGCSLEIAMDE